MKESTKKKILVVEDEKSQSKALSDKFIREGFDIILAKDGEEGLSVALKERPDIILLDILMPRMDGMTMLKKLRQANAWGKSVPVIMLTNLSPDDDKIKKGVAEDNPDYYLIKSNWAINDVVATVKERLSRLK